MRPCHLFLLSAWLWGLMWEWMECVWTLCIYFVPKIHKHKNPGRPIVSACSGPTELISSYLEIILASIVKTLLSYIKTSQHALENFRNFNFLGQNKLLFIIDITSLYTVVPNDEGLLARKHFFDQRTVKEPSSETLFRPAEPVLTLNCFLFGGNHYKQTNGVAMGTRIGPSYANLFVGFIEHQFFLINTTAPTWTFWSLHWRLHWHYGFPTNEKNWLNLKPPSIPFTRLWNIPGKFSTLLWLF